MIEYFKQILEFFYSVGQFLLNIIKHPMAILRWLIDTVKLANTSLSYFLPVGIVASLTIFLAIAVIYKFFGRTS